MANDNWYCSTKNEQKRKIQGIITDVSFHFNLSVDDDKDTVTITYKYKPIYIRKGLSSLSDKSVLTEFLSTLHKYIDVCLHIENTSRFGKINVEDINEGRRGLLAVISNGDNTRANR